MKEYKIEFIVKTNAPMKTMLNVLDTMEVQLEFLEERESCVCDKKTYKYEIKSSELSETVKRH